MRLNLSLCLFDETAAWRALGADARLAMHDVPAPAHGQAPLACAGIFLSSASPRLLTTACDRARLKRQRLTMAMLQDCARALGLAGLSAADFSTTQPSLRVTQVLT